VHILILEAYDGGSHKQFLDGLVAHSRHRYTRLGLPARKWKWRMRGSALYFAARLRAPGSAAEAEGCQAELIFTSDMTSAADLRALLPAPLNRRPLVAYFHENQLTYPLPEEAQRDYQFGMTNITSCLAADAVWFNSQYHQEEFLAAVEGLLRRMPDYVPTGTVEGIRSRAAVLPLGLDEELFEIGRRRAGGHPPTVRSAPAAESGCPSTTAGAPRTGAGEPAGVNGQAPVRILWNHRWEYDKNPEEFFAVLLDLQRAGVPFRLLVAGQSFRQAPPIFAAAREQLAGRIEHFGTVPDRRAYRELLGRADVAVSTARHEFFGLAVREATAAGCFPLLPRRLSYPELVPGNEHTIYLYGVSGELRERLACLCRHGAPPLSAGLRGAVEALAWPRLIGRYDEAFEEAARRGGGG